MSFFGIGSEDEHVRLKSYGAVIKGPVAILRLEIEVRDTYELGFMLRGLEELQQAGKARPKRPAKAAEQKKIGHQARLALPAPNQEGWG